MNKDKIVIFQSKDGIAKLDVRLEEETVWLNLNQLTNLFQRDKSVISRHINNIFKEKELHRHSVVAKYATTASDGKTYQVDFYNLDVIISIGYRIRSKRGTQFRIWANQVIKDYLVKGYALNEKRLAEVSDRLEEVTTNLQLIGRVFKQKSLSEGENQAFLNLITDYAIALDLLDKYDHQKITDPGGAETATFRITFENAMAALERLKKQSSASDLFAAPKDDSFHSSLSTIYQTFDGKELYPSLEDKAAHLLYFVVENHSFIDGNKRIGAFIFIWFLDRNKALLNENGLHRINNETLVALTILIAESKPDEKELIVNLIKHLIKSGIK